MAGELPISSRPGYATENSCVVLLVSLSNAAATFVPNIGSATPVVWQQYGTDHPTPVGALSEAGFVAHVTVSGLSSNTGYSYVVTQAANILNGAFRTKPADNDDFSMFVVTCDVNPAGPVGGSSNGFGSNSAGWEEIKNYAQTGALPVAGVLHLDDVNGYVDLTQVDDSAVSGKSMFNIFPAIGALGTIISFDYCLAHLNAFGLFSDSGPAAAFQTWAHDPNRVWCTNNLNYMYQWGDHEFVDDLGYDVDPNDGAGGQERWEAGKIAWDGLIAPIMPPVLSANSTAWAIDFGCIHIATTDGITNGNAVSGVGRTMFGSGQIADLKADLESSIKPFKILGMANGIRYLDNTEAEFESGTQHPVFSEALSEYQDLFTNDIDGLMTRDGLNGGWGQFWTMHGDYHRGMVMQNHAPAYLGNVAENFKTIKVATIGGSRNFRVDGNIGNTGIVEGLDFNGSLIEYLQDNGLFSYPDPADEFGWQVCRLDVYGSRSPKEVSIVMKRARANLPIQTEYTHTFLELPMDIKFSDPAIRKVAADVTEDAVVALTNDLAGTPADAAMLMSELAIKMSRRAVITKLSHLATLDTVYQVIDNLGGLSKSNNPNIVLDALSGTITVVNLSGVLLKITAGCTPVVAALGADKFIFAIHKNGAVSGGEAAAVASTIDPTISKTFFFTPGSDAPIVFDIRQKTDAATPKIFYTNVSPYLMIEIV